MPASGRPTALAGCARCHDHKIDPIPQADYYRLKAVFAGVQHGERARGGRQIAERARAIGRKDDDVETTPQIARLKVRVTDHRVLEFVLVEQPFGPPFIHAGGERLIERDAAAHDAAPSPAVSEDEIAAASEIALKGIE